MRVIVISFASLRAQRRNPAGPRVRRYVANAPMRRWLSALVMAGVVICGAGEARALGAGIAIPSDYKLPILVRCFDANKPKIGLVHGAVDTGVFYPTVYIDSLRSVAQFIVSKRNPIDFYGIKPVNLLLRGVGVNGLVSILKDFWNFHAFVIISNKSSREHTDIFCRSLTKIFKQDFDNRGLRQNSAS